MYFLRKIRKQKWERDGATWLAPDALQADALGDLRTNENSLSIFLVNPNRNNLERVIAAMAATTDSLSNFDYALVPFSVVESGGFNVVNVPGDTPDDGVNQAHRDLAELSAQQLLDLATLIQSQAIERKRISHKDVKRFINRALSAGELNRSKLNAKITAELGI